MRCGSCPEDERTLDTRKVLPGVQHVIAIASGKGGVGKSTVTANLAVELARRGHSVGLVDADIHGPSMPTMFDVVREKPEPVDKDGKPLIGPVEAHGVKLLSIGFFADPDQAIVWRGPMASKALGQLFTDGDWGELDYLLVDLPPGTGDVHLSLVQLVPLSGVVVVSTPQDIALADARKGVSMFQLESINVPVLGLVENMAYFSPPDLPDRKYHLFGRDGVKRYAEASDTPFLGELPLVQAIREAGDAGRPAALQDGTEAAAGHRRRGRPDAGGTGTSPPAPVRARTMVETPATTQDLRERIDRALDELRPFLRSDGGDIQSWGQGRPGPWRWSCRGHAPIVLRPR